MEPTDSWTAIIQQPLFSHSSDAIMLLDSNGLMLHFNDECSRLLGVHSAEWLHHSFAPLLEVDDGDSFLSYFKGALRGFPSNMEVEFSHPSIQSLQLRLRLIPVEANGEQFVFLVMRDVTDQKRSLQLIEHMAYHDTLTGLPNRTMFQIQLTQTIAASYNKSTEPLFAILLINLDRFQIVSDSLGHN